jgi:hypothetical protein
MALTTSVPTGLANDFDIWLFASNPMINPKGAYRVCWLVVDGFPRAKQELANSKGSAGCNCHIQRKHWHCVVQTNGLHYLPLRSALWHG